MRPTRPPTIDPASIPFTCPNLKAPHVLNHTGPNTDRAKLPPTKRISKPSAAILKVTSQTPASPSLGGTLSRQQFSSETLIKSMSDPAQESMHSPRRPTDGTERHDRNMVLMFTDVVDSVAIKRRIGDIEYVQALQSHLARLKACALAEPGAAVIKSTGDGLLIRFATPGDAVRAALRMQADGTLSANTDSDSHAAIRLPDRIGIHSGTGIETTDPNGNPDVAGLAVDMAARIMGLCETGQILLTRAAFDDARQFVREHPLAAPAANAGKALAIQWMAHGPYLFKGNDDALEIFEVGTSGLAPLRAPKDSEKARRAVTPGDEAMYDWRPAVGLALPRRDYYFLERKLGEGGFGEVWLAKHRKTGDKRVFKFCFDSDRLRSFRRELTLFRLLREALGDRRDIARIFDVSLESPPFFLESEYAVGGDLYEWSAAKGGIGTLSLDQRLDLLRRIAEAVAAAHSVGVLHKDLKPSNVLMDAGEDGSPRPKLADFGIGILADRSRLEGANFTVAGFTAGGLTMNDSSRTGTRLYSPPESMTSVQTRDGAERAAAPFTAKGDVYALGVMLYQFVIGDLDRPLAIGWEGNVAHALKDSRHTRGESKPGAGDGTAHAGPDAVRAGDPWLEKILVADIAAMVQGDPDRRMAGAAEVASRLATVRERGARLERDEVARKAAEEADRRAMLAEARRRKAVLAGVVSVLVLVVILAIGGYALVSIDAERDNAQSALAAKQQAESERAEAERKAAAIHARNRELRLAAVTGAKHRLAEVPLPEAMEAASNARRLWSGGAGDVVPPMVKMEMGEATFQLLESINRAEMLLQLQTDPIGEMPAGIISEGEYWRSLQAIWEARSLAIRLAMESGEFGLALAVYQAAEAQMARRMQSLQDGMQESDLARWRETAPKEAMDAASLLSALGESIVHRQGEQLRWRRQRIEAALADVSAGLGRAGRPMNAPGLEDYQYELVAYRDMQTLELLEAELNRHLPDAVGNPEAPAAGKPAEWTEAERNTITLCCRVMGRIGMGDKAVAALEPASRALWDHALVLEVGAALGATMDVSAFPVLEAMWNRVGPGSGTGYALLAYFRRLPEPDPGNDPEAFARRGQMRTVKGDLEGAIADFDSALKADPGNAHVLSLRGWAKHGIGDSSGGIVDCTAALNFSPDHKTALTNRGLIRHSTGDPKGAIKDFTRVIELFPGDPAAYTNRGLAKQESGDPNGAIEDYTSAIAIDSAFSRAYNNRGNAYSMLDRLQDAMADYSRCIELMPGDPVSRTSLGRAKWLAGDHAGAIAECSRAIEIDPRYAKAYVYRGYARSQVGEQVAAMSDFTSALEIAPDSTDAHYGMGEALARDNQHDKAVAEFSRAIALRPRFMEAYEKRAFSKIRLGDPKGAVEDFTSALDIVPNRLTSLLNRGIVRRANKDWKGGLEDFERSLEISPNHVDALFNRGFCKFNLGDPAGAIADYDAAIERAPGHGWAWANRGVAKESTGDIDGAITDYRQALVLLPGNATLRKNLDDLLKRSSQPKSE